VCKLPITEKKIGSERLIIGQDIIKSFWLITFLLTL